MKNKQDNLQNLNSFELESISGGEGSLWYHIAYYVTTAIKDTVHYIRHDLVTEFTIENS